MKRKPGPPPKAPRGKARPSPTSRLPIYDSIQACSASTGIPASALKEAKRRGCLAFQHSRVDLEKFLAFTFSPDGKAIQNWAEHKLEGEAKRVWIKLEKDAGNVIDRGAVRDGIAQLAGAIDSSLEKVFVNEFPPACMGLDAMGVSQLAKRFKERLWETIKAHCGAIVEIESK